MCAAALAACGLTVVGLGTSDREARDAAAAAADGAASVDADVAATGDASREPALPVIARLNVNGATHAGVDLPGTWSAAPVPGPCGPSAYANSAALHGTRDQALFQGEAFGNPARCAIGGGALAAGTYRVRLHFAEVYFGAGCPGGGGVGSRVFDIVLEGTTVEKDVDVLEESGGCLASDVTDAGAPLVREFDVSVLDGTLDVALPATADNGKLSALEVLGPL